MCENGKMRAVETIPGVGVGVIKENNGGGELNCDTYYKNFGKCYNVLPIQQ
jgi:hypothetical protein